MSYYVCDELIDNIFKRLPSKSLLRFRCLSKSWCSRITSSDFIRTHLRQNQQKILIKHMATSKELDMEFFYTIHSEDQLPLNRKDVYMGIGKFPNDDCIIVGSCNGLLVLRNHPSGTITLWNPSIRRKLTVPPPQEYGSLWFLVGYGFGFNTVTDDYKIVMIFYSISRRSPSRSMVYTTNTNTWRTIGSPFTRISDVMGYGCFVKGALHWIVRDHDKGHPYVMSFDLSTEVFGRVCLLPKPILKATRLIAVNGSLAVFTRDTSNLTIWVMGEDDDVVSWSIFFKLEVLPSEKGIFGVFPLTTNGDFVFQTYRDGYKVYNTTTGIRSTLVNFNADSVLRKTERYVESLVLLNKGTVCNETNSLGSNQKSESRKRELEDSS